MQTYGLIGNGSWATAIAKILTDNGHKIHWWMRSQDAIDFFLEKHHNNTYLASVKFEMSQIKLTGNIEEVFEECDSIIICVPSAYLLSVIEPVDKKLFQSKTIISAVKGILPDYFLLLNEYLAEKKSVDILSNYACITGPCHAEEVAQEKLSYLTFSSANTVLTERLSNNFRNAYLKTIQNTDIVGTQYASIFKNIYAIGAGIIHGIGYGDNFMSVYITNCFREMIHFFETQGMCTSDAISENVNSAYLGDLLVTCYSLHSRNRRFGNLLGQGYNIQNAILEMGMMAEGYYASKGMKAITTRYNCDLKILNAIYGILWENIPYKYGIKEIESILI